VIVVDTSALVAIVQEEPGHTEIDSFLFAQKDKRIAATALVELVMVLSREYSEPRSVVDGMLRRANLSVQPIDEAHAAVAQQAFLTYGKGRHRARLNFGDCFSYAAAKLADAPLLFVGSDFAETDIRSAL
jgi:ribonuclease VapC